jgi:hypothetical protein
MKNTIILGIAEQIVEDMKSLNQILFQLGDNFNVLSFETEVLHEMPQTIDEKIKELINRIEENFNRLCFSIKNEMKIEPINQDNMNRIILNITTQYLFISANNKLDNVIRKNYTIGLNRISLAFNNLSCAINDYNEIAGLKKLPKIQTINELLSIAKQQIISLE